MNLSRRETLRVSSLRPEQVITFLNGVDTVRFDGDRYREERAQIRRRFGLKDEDVVLMFSGRLVEEKGIRQLMEAFVQVPCGRLKLLAVGSSWSRLQR